MREFITQFLDPIVIGILIAVPVFGLGGRWSSASAVVCAAGIARREMNPGERPGILIVDLLPGEEYTVRELADPA